MGSASKEKVELARAEAAERLQALGTQLSEGTIRLGDASFLVPDHVALEIEADEDEFEIEIKWRHVAGHVECRR